MTQPALLAEQPVATEPDGRMAPWLVEHIRTTTGADPGSRWARVGRCPSCRAKVIRGLDEDDLATEIDVDSTPLSPLGEALVRLDGSVTVWLRSRLTPSGRRWMLLRRDRWHIGGQLSPTAELGFRARADVVAEHRCGRELPAAGRAPTRLVRPPPRPDPDSAPPF